MSDQPEELPTDHLDTGQHPVLLFDGVCNLCNGAIQFVIERDPEGLFRFAPIQSEIGERLCREYGVSTDDLETVVLLEDGECYTKSTAALRVARRLGLPYSLLVPFIAVPGPIRDVVYDVIATYRYRVFGRRDSCMMPSEDVRDRFLQQTPTERD